MTTQLSVRIVGCTSQNTPSLYTDATRIIIERLTQEGVKIVKNRNKMTLMNREQNNSNCIVVLPGGVESCHAAIEAISLTKPILIVNISGFYDNLILQFRRAESEGLLDIPVEALFTVVDNADDAVKWCLGQRSVQIDDSMSWLMFLSIGYLIGLLGISSYIFLGYVAIVFVCGKSNLSRATDEETLDETLDKDLDKDLEETLDREDLDETLDEDLDEDLDEETLDKDLEETLDKDLEETLDREDIDKDLEETLDKDLDETPLDREDIDKDLEEYLAVENPEEDPAENPYHHHLGIRDISLSQYTKTFVNDHQHKVCFLNRT